MGFEIMARIGADGTGFARALNVAERQAQSFAKQVTHEFSAPLSNLGTAFAGAFSVAAIEGAIHSTIQYASEIKNLAEQQGISTDEAQKFQIASGMVGLEQEAIATGLRSLGEARKKAAEGATEEGAKMRDTFRRFGVEMKDLQNPMMRNVDLFYKMGDAVRSMNLTGRDREELRELLGKSGPKLQALMRALGEVGDRPLISPEQVAELKHAEHVLEELERRRKVGTANVLTNPSTLLDANLGTLGFLWRGGKAIANFFGGGSKGTAASGSEFLGPPSEPFFQGQEDKLFQDFSQDAASKRMVALRKQIQAAHLRTLSPSARRADLQRQLAENQNRMGPFTEEEGLQQQLERENLLGELHGMKQHEHPMMHDALAAIGGGMEFAGNTGVVHLEQISRNTKDTVQAIKARGASSRGGFPR